MCSSATTELAELASRPRWDPLRTLALPGRCRGSVLAHWADNVRRRFGASALARVRAGLPTWAHDLPDDPPREAWFPVGLQLYLTELVVDECLGGDMLRLESPLHEDIRRSLPRGVALLMRTLGPSRILGGAEQIHPQLYDVGRAYARSESHRASIRCEGAKLFGHPSFVLLQVFAQRGFVELTGRRVHTLCTSCPSEDALAIDVRWH
jgi:hypothetical protein